MSSKLITWHTELLGASARDAQKRQIKLLFCNWRSFDKRNISNSILYTENELNIQTVNRDDKSYETRTYTVTRQNRGHARPHIHAAQARKMKYYL